MSHITFTRSIVAALLLLSLPCGAIRPAASASSTSPTAASLAGLLKERRYLEFEQLLSEPNDLSPTDRNFYLGILSACKNRPTESLRLLEPLLISRQPTPLTAEQQKTGWLALADDYSKTCQYGKSADAAGYVLKQFPDLLTDDEKTSIDGDREGTILMKDFPAETVDISGPFTLQSKRDPVGLIEGPVVVAGNRVSAVFDTGADTTVLTVSVARQLGCKIVAGSAPAVGAAGDTFQAQMALIPTLRIGSAVFHNVASAVFDDKLLYISQVPYQIPMIVGYPEIAALGRVTFYADGRIGQGVQQGDPGAEMFLIGNKPLIVARTGKGLRLFNLDTGAPGTLLYNLYWQENREAFVGKTPTPYRVLGAGGSHVAEAFNGCEVSLGFGSRRVILHHVSVLTGPHNTDAREFFYGNLGQDLLLPLRSWTLDLRAMRFVIDPGN